MKPTVVAATMFMVLLCLLVATPAQADWPSWKLPSLNPFAKKETPQRRTVARPASTRSQQPGTLQRMTNGTRNFFSKTADALTPWDNNPPRKPLPPPTGAARTYSSSPRTASKPAPSTWQRVTSWFGGETPQPPPPRSVDDFMALERPNF